MKIENEDRTAAFALGARHFAWETRGTPDCLITVTGSGVMSAIFVDVVKPGGPGDTKRRRVR